MVTRCDFPGLASLTCAKLGPQGPWDLILSSPKHSCASVVPCPTQGWVLGEQAPPRLSVLHRVHVGWMVIHRIHSAPLCARPARHSRGQRTVGAL